MPSKPIETVRQVPWKQRYRNYITTVMWDHSGNNFREALGSPREW